IWRAPIDNDKYQIEDWKEKYFVHQGREKLIKASHEIRRNGTMIRFEKRFSTTNQSWGFDLAYEYLFKENGTLTLSVKGTPYQRGTNNPQMIPRIGIEAYLSGELDEVSWFGMGPGENYSDSLRA